MLFLNCGVTSNGDVHSPVLSDGFAYFRRETAGPEPGVILLERSREPSVEP
jgi:hypothetical protein